MPTEQRIRRGVLLVKAALLAGALLGAALAITITNLAHGTGHAPRTDPPAHQES